MAAQLETTQNQAQINGALSFAFVMVMDILQTISPDISNDERFARLKQVIKDTPDRRPPGCRISVDIVNAVRPLLSASISAEFDQAFWNTMTEDQP